MRTRDGDCGGGGAHVVYFPGLPHASSTDTDMWGTSCCRLDRSSGCWNKIRSLVVSQMSIYLRPGNTPVVIEAGELVERERALATKPAAAKISPPIILHVLG